MTWHLAPFLCPHGKITLSLLCCLSLGRNAVGNHAATSITLLGLTHSPVAHRDLYSIGVELRPILLYALLTAAVNYSLSTVISHRLHLSEWK